MRTLPLVGFVAFVAVGLLWRSWLQRRRYGASGFALFRSGRWAQHLREGAMLVVGGAMGWQAVASLVTPDVIDGMRVLPGATWLSWCGSALMLAGTVLMAAAQLDLGASWRIGIDGEARPGLVVGGLYRYSRNPIFLAALLAVVGFVLLVPTWLSFTLLAAMVFGVYRQVRDEEAYLQRAYGDAYTAYARRVGRFLPRLVR